MKSKPFCFFEKDTVGRIDPEKHQTLVESRTVLEAKDHKTT